MTTRPSPVETAVQLRLLAPGAAAVPVAADLRYELDDPYAVQVCFHTRSAAATETVCWTFARSLLGEGLVQPAGEGDVQVWPSSTDSGPVVCLSLSSPSGMALFELPLAELALFLARTYDVVPIGREGEHVDLDAELAKLFWAEPGTEGLC